MADQNTLSRRGLFMKMGILFNGLVATALAVPIVGFLLSSITRGRANAYEQTRTFRGCRWDR